MVSALWGLATCGTASPLKTETVSKERTESAGLATVVQVPPDLGTVRRGEGGIFLLFGFGSSLQWGREGVPSFSGDLSGIGAWGQVYF